MPDLHHLLLFIAAGLVLNLTPGPDVMFIIANAVRGGLRTGLAAALGISAGCLVHVFAAAVGVSALLMASSTAFTALKWLGAVYLVWVGLQMLRGALWQNTTKSIATSADSAGAGAAFDSKTAAVTPAPLPMGAVLRRGFLTNVLNPKVFLVLGLIFTANGLLVCVGWALVAAWAARRAGALQRAMRWLDGVAGGLFVAFGVKLAFTEAPR